MSNYAKAFHIPLFQVLQKTCISTYKTTGLKIRAKAVNDILKPSFNVVHIHVHTYIHMFSFHLSVKKLPYLAFLLNIETKESFQCLCTAALESIFIFLVLSNVYISLEK